MIILGMLKHFEREKTKKANNHDKKQKIPTKNCADFRKRTSVLYPLHVGFYVSIPEFSGSPPCIFGYILVG
jgi:hypothetical protein